MVALGGSRLCGVDCDVLAAWVRSQTPPHQVTSGDTLFRIKEATFVLNKVYLLFKRWRKLPFVLSRTGRPIACPAIQGGGHDEVVDRFFRQASLQYRTASQFLAQALRQLMGRPQAWQGLRGRWDLWPLRDWLGMAG
jgi:hypothetical protein